jgi:GntR family transcriptional regulator / MocR family aminotransferase
MKAFSAALHLAARLLVPVRARALAARADGAGIRVHSVDRFAISKPAPNAIALGFGMIPVDRIGVAGARLCDLF